jgi:MFS family permease
MNIRGRTIVNDEVSGQRTDLRTDLGTARREATILLAMLAATAILSQFFRSSNSVIWPELIRDLSLSSEALGFANGCFFAALLLVQIPVGIAFDRIGPRLTVGVLSVLMTAGALLHAAAQSGAELALARFVVGLGCAGSFMAGVVLISRWFPRPSWATVLSWLFALSQFGLLLAGLPLAIATETIGWRVTFVIMGVIAALVGVLFLVIVRDRPPGPVIKPSEPVKGLEGVRLVLATPGLLRVLALFAVAYAAFATVLVLWAGPYLHDVYGLGPIQRGYVLLAMAACQTVGGLCVGPLDRIFNTRKWVVVGTASLSLSMLIVLATVPLSLTGALAALLVLSASSAYGSVLLAHIRSHFPDHLAGRGATTGNMAQLAGAALLPMLTGLIPPLFPINGSDYSPLAYKWIFATLATALALGLAVYLTSEDAKPHAGEPGDLPTPD